MDWLSFPKTLLTVVVGLVLVAALVGLGVWGCFLLVEWLRNG